MPNTTKPLFSSIIPVSKEEVEKWLDGVPNLSSSTFRREAYRKAYNVEDKIRTIKRNHNKLG